MAVTEAEFVQAKGRALTERAAGHVQAAWYNQRRGRVIVHLSTGVEVAFPATLAEGLANASPEELVEIEISPSGLGLYWPRLDADLYVPALFAGRLWFQTLDGVAHGRGRGRELVKGKTNAAKGDGCNGGRRRHILGQARSLSS